MASKKEILIVPENDFQKGYITLPLNENQFAEFISGLLGAPQTITRRIFGTFLIQLKDLQNFHDLIQQRIAQQNNGRLIQLKTQIYFSDNSSVTLGSYEELVTYNETKAVKSEAVRLTWAYLIQFADKKAPEKQVIEILIKGTGSNLSIDDEEYFRSASSRYGAIKITIQHTARSFGSDIEQLITNQINSIAIHPSKWKVFTRAYHETISTWTIALLFLSTLVGVFFNTGRFNELEKNKIAEIVKKNNSDSNIKINYLLDYIASNKQNVYFLEALFFLIGSLIVAIGLGTWVGNYANTSIKSYVVLTREAEKRRKLDEKREEKTTLIFIISIVTSIATGVLGNYIFSLLAIK